MYLLSLYFDNETDICLQNLINKVAEKTGNFYMLDKAIPPHITIAEINDGEENLLIQTLDYVIRNWSSDKLDWVSIGSFKPHVLFLQPVLNTYLNELSVSVNKILSEKGLVKEESRYIPFNWLPHTTIARNLSESQMEKAFKVLQTNFVPFSGKVIKAGLAKSNPYHDIYTWEL